MAKMGVKGLFLFSCSIPCVLFYFLSFVIGWSDVYKTMYEYNAMPMPFTKINPLYTKLHILSYKTIHK